MSDGLVRALFAECPAIVSMRCDLDDGRRAQHFNVEKFQCDTLYVSAEQPPLMRDAELNGK